MLRAVTFRYWSPLTAQLIRPARSVSTVPSIFRHFTTTTRYCYAAKGKEEPEDSFFTPEERAKYAAINEWREKFTKEKIPYRTFNITYMRSSGPGGQNVNKVATKVDMRFELKYATWMPEPVRQKLAELQAGRLNKHGELVFTSDRTRSQKMNLDDCVDKLYEAILEAAQTPKEPDEEQRAKVKRMKEAEKRRRKEEKQRRSEKKSSRRIRFDD